MICEASSSWFLVYALARLSNEALTPSTFNLAEVSKEHPTQIARTVLLIAVCLQQLDPDFDTSQLRLYPTVEARMDKCINVVQALITSDDELASTVVGLECLVLQGVFHINAGNPRRAWLIFRRAISIGQLMGVHKRECTLPGGRQIWYQVVQADRYLVGSPHQLSLTRVHFIDTLSRLFYSAFRQDQTMVVLARTRHSKIRI